ncbi:MAG: hypothetical protein HQL19_00415 [Candidatus Omnitrophica bacterium]|nr:hypothetical protein [Candidatus Omnitrophota bacterium]
MKNVTYKKRSLPENRGRVVSVREALSDQECDSRSMKNYVYILSRADAVPKDIPVPEIHVTKRIMNEGQDEAFFLKVKGIIYTTKGRFIYKVDYCHSLTVQMHWKTHVLSSKDPAALA